MKITSNTLLIFIAVMVLGGCGKKTLNCADLKDQGDRTQCVAHNESTEPRGPSKLPSNPKKW
jgi:hypothetical protein